MAERTEKTRPEKELAFAHLHMNHLEPENLGRSMLFPHASLAVARQPFAPLMTLARRLEDRADRIVLYRAVGLAVMKMCYALRMRHVVDVRGAGLTPEPVQHENVELLTLAAAHLGMDRCVTENARDLQGDVHHALVRAVKTVYPSVRESR